MGHGPGLPAAGLALASLLVSASGQVPAAPGKERDLAVTIMQVARKLGLAEKLVIKSRGEEGVRRLPAPRVTVRFKVKQGFRMDDLLRFLEAIENAGQGIRVVTFSPGKRIASSGQGALWWSRGFSVLRVREGAAGEWRAQPSALTRTRAFRQALQRLESAAGPIHLARLDVGLGGLAWDMRLKDLRSWPAIQQALAKLEGVTAVTLGTTAAEDGSYTMRSNRLAYASSAHWPSPPAGAPLTDRPAAGRVDLARLEGVSRALVRTAREHSGFAVNSLRTAGRDVRLELSLADLESLAALVQELARLPRYDGLRVIRLETAGGRKPRAFRCSADLQFRKT